MKRLLPLVLAVAVFSGCPGEPAATPAAEAPPTETPATPEPTSEAPPTEEPATQSLPTVTYYAFDG